MVAVAATALLIGCQNPSITYLGNWTGNFVITQNKSGFTDKQMNLRGYLQIYNYDQKFKMEVANPVQKVKLTGNWELNKQQILLHFASVKIEQPTKDLMKAMNHPYLEDRALKAGFEQNIIFDVNKSHTKLHGLLMSIGPLTGHFELQKTGPARSPGIG